MGEKLELFNSKKMDNNCEIFKNILLNESDALKLFKTAQEIFETSGLDMDKKQYKSESETELLVTAYQSYKKVK